MKKITVKEREHPEIQDIKNTCIISPEAKTTKEICSKIKKNKGIKQKNNTDTSEG